MELTQKLYGKNRDSDSVISLRDCLTGLDTGMAGADSPTVSVCTPQSEFDTVTNRRILLTEFFHATPSEDEKKPAERRM